MEDNMRKTMCVHKHTWLGQCYTAEIGITLYTLIKSYNTIKYRNFLLSHNNIKKLTAIWLDNSYRKGHSGGEPMQSSLQRTWIPKSGVKSLRFQRKVLLWCCHELLWPGLGDGPHLALPALLTDSALESSLSPGTRLPLIKMIHKLKVCGSPPYPLICALKSQVRHILTPLV